MTTASTPFSDLLPDWVRMSGDYIIPRTPVRIVVRSAPMVEVFFEGAAQRMGVRFAFEGRFDSAFREILTEIHIDEVLDGGRRFIEMWTDRSVLFRSFYSLLLEVVGDVVTGGTPSIKAISAAVGHWEQLLSRPSHMSEEKQIGLFGELWLLDRLTKTMGAGALDAWVGPIPEVHDFRTAQAEFEVKTTSGSERRHKINGLGQLTPSVGWPLYLLSIQITNGGTGGRTLPDLIDAVRLVLNTMPGADERFSAHLSSVGYEDADRSLYETKRKLRSEPVLIPIVDGMPRLTEAALHGLPAEFSPARISNVVYEVDVSGLGHADGSPPFLELIPNG